MGGGANIVPPAVFKVSFKTFPYNQCLGFTWIPVTYVWWPPSFDQDKKIKLNGIFRLIK